MVLSTKSLPTEHTPLRQDNAGGPGNGSSVKDASINIAKVCIGTGMLALPFAVSQGGLLTGALGLAIIALWNDHASHLLYNLRARLHKDTYASLAAHLFGRHAAVVVNICNIATLLGVITVYTITFAELLHDTPLALSAGGVTTSSWRESLLCALLVLPLSFWRHLGALTRSSFLGLIFLIAGFGAIFYYGVLQYGITGLGTVLNDEGNDVGAGYCHTGSATPSASSSSLFFPDSADAASRYFGVAAFCYGIPPLQFSLQDSMTEPTLYPLAARRALLIVWFTYVVCGVGIAFLYRCDPLGVEENCLENLPTDSAAASAVRLCYAVVCVTSIPLCLAPVADMTEKAICGGDDTSVSNNSNGFDEDVATVTSTNPQTTTIYSPPMVANARQIRLFRNIVRPRLLIVRLILVCIATSIAIAAPHFGLIVAIIGSFSVSLLSFVLPSAMHLAVITGDVMTAECFPRRQYQVFEGFESNEVITSSLRGGNGVCGSQWVTREMAREGVLLAFGVATCVLTTTLTVLSAAGAIQ
jgi:amino acid permease